MEPRFPTRIGPAKLLSMLALAAIIPALMLTTSASAYLYWEGRGGIWRADLNGGGVDDSFIPSPYAPEGGGEIRTIALSGKHIYFASSIGLIGRADLDGGGVVPDFVTIPQPPPLTEVEIDASSLAIGGAYLYWATGDGNSTGNGNPTQPARESIGRVGIDGRGVEPNFIKAGIPVYAVRVAAGHVYWLTQHAIGRANLDGRSVQPNFIPLRTTTTVHWFTVGEGHIYWATAHAIARANLDGRGIDTRFITGIADNVDLAIYSVAVGNGYIYWDIGETSEIPTEQIGHFIVPNPPLESWIGRANIDGSHVRQSFIDAGQGASELAVNTLGPGAAHPPRHVKSRPKRRLNHRR